MKLKLAVIFLGFLSIFACGSSGEDENSETNTTETIMNKDFKISLAQWSLHKSFFGEAQRDWQWFNKMLHESPDSVLKGKLNPMDFPGIAASYGIYCIELVNTFYFGKADDMEYWEAFKNKCKQEDVTVGLIMCDALGQIGNTDSTERTKAVENHYKWVDVAKYLGAHSIRVNAAGDGTAEEVAEQAVDGLQRLGKYASSKGINVIVENHGGYSSDGKWLSQVIKQVGMDNVGTLPDFGNFCIEYDADGCKKEYDRYQGMTDLMPYAKGVSAKSNDFDEEGNETHSDFLKMMKIVKASGFKGFIGIEYEGNNLSEDEGIKKTKALLEKVFAEL